MRKTDFNEKNSDNMLTRFIYLGDPQSSRISGEKNDYSLWEKLLRRTLSELREYEPANKEKALVLIGGDLVNSAGNQEEWDAFFESCDRINSEFDLTFVSAAGNFSSSGGYEKREDFRERFYLPGNGPYGFEDSFYSFDRGCAHFLVLDSNYLYNPDRAVSKYIGAWIKHDLATNSRPACFAVMHHPVYTLESSFDDEVRASIIRQNYMQLLHRYGVDFILCGHQHVYSRTADNAMITQLMGVSGTKYQRAEATSGMQCVIEGRSLATVFTVTETSAALSTIDPEGRHVDRHLQKLKSKRTGEKCIECINFPSCKGTGLAELLEMEEKAKRHGAALVRNEAQGLKINGYDFSLRELRGISTRESEYSVFRRNRLKHEKKKGMLLSELLADHDRPGNALMFISRDGNIKTLKKSEIMNAWCFRNAGTCAKKAEVTAIIVEDGGPGDFRLIFGQQNPEQYNGRGWIRHIAEIRTLDTGNLQGCGAINY